MAKRKSTRKSSQRSVRNDSIRLSFESLERRLCLAVISVPTDMGLAAAIATADSNADNDNIINLSPGSYPLTEQVISAPPTKTLQIVGQGRE